MNTPDSPATGPVTTDPSFDGYVVCIGASAGGLDALEKFFSRCPTDCGAAFVVIQHLSPDHKSMMSNLLARHTAMPVIMVEDEMAIAADRVYLIPPGAVMHASAGRLHLTPKNPRGLTLPIDIFFGSLASVYGPRAVGVVLSGTGTDGTRGAVAINAAEGFLMAQEPESAAFDGMPRSAIATGLVDAVLPAEQLAARLVAHIRHLPYEDACAPRDAIPYAHMSSEEVFGAVMHLLHQVGGIDFTDYKPTTVMRRIQRRQQVRHTPELYQYLDLLENDRAEILVLRRELLISVTSFFRDPDTFALLDESVIVPLVRAKAAADSIRVWVAGVATGEEAYSVGMMFLEAFEAERRWPNLKIFATDVDPQCIDTAGVGLYPESAAAELSPERLERFFTRKGDQFLVRNDLRQCVVFARHNLLGDPPFTKMDLVVCRNTLIYFKAPAQERVLRSLQYAIVDGGALLLGPSESLSADTQGLNTLNAKHKLFRRQGTAVPPLPGTRMRVTASAGQPAGGRTAARNDARDTAPAQAGAGLSALLEHYAPPAVLVDGNHQIRHLYGAVAEFLRTKEGAASLDLNRLLPDALTPVASALLYKASRERCTLTSHPVALARADGTASNVRLSARPVGAGEERLTLLCFEPAAPAGDAEPATVDVDAETVNRITVLERELAATRESLQATIEELETSNEELQATNEELMASNEELQSSNEELQSVNEEMSTVNAEFQEKMLVLNRVNADLDGMAKAAGVATVFVDARAHITRFSPDATQVFKLRASDVGRRLDDISHTLDYPRLMSDLEQTLALRRTTERETRALDGVRRFLVRMLPYEVPSTTEAGAVVTFVDVTAIHDAQRLQAVIDALPENVAVIDPAGRIVMFNAAWRRFARANGDPDLLRSGVGANYLDACRVDSAGDADAAASAGTAMRGLRGVLEGTLPSFSLEYPCHSPDEQRWFVMNVAPVHGHGIGAVVSHVDISAWRGRARSS